MSGWLGNESVVFITKSLLEVAIFFLEVIIFDDVAVGTSPMLQWMTLTCIHMARPNRSSKVIENKTYRKLREGLVEWNVHQVSIKSEKSLIL